MQVLFFAGPITEVYSINGVAVWKPPAVTGGDLTGFHIRLYYYSGGDVVVAEEEDIDDPDIKWWLPGEPMPAQRPLFCQVGCTRRYEAVIMYINFND